MNTEYLVWVVLLVGVSIGAMLFLVFAELPDFPELADVGDAGADLADVAGESPAPARRTRPHATPGNLTEGGPSAAAAGEAETSAAVAGPSTAAAGEAETGAARADPAESAAP